MRSFARSSFFLYSPLACFSLSFFLRSFFLSCFPFVFHASMVREIFAWICATHDTQHCRMQERCETRLELCATWSSGRHINKRKPGHQNKKRVFCPSLRLFLFCFVRYLVFPKLPQKGAGLTQKFPVSSPWLTKEFPVIPCVFPPNSLADKKIPCHPPWLTKQFPVIPCVFPLNSLADKQIPCHSPWLTNKFPVIPCVFPVCPPSPYCPSLTCVFFCCPPAVGDCVVFPPHLYAK